ncbi:MAG: F0F1 ATP synthase subunit B [Dehalococcoidia bacterium]
MGDLGINLSGLLTQLASFLILFTILYLLLYKPIIRMLDQRSDRIKESLEAANRAREEAASSAEQVEREMINARQEGQKLIAEAREAAGRFREQEESRAQAQVEEMLNRARAAIERERDSAIEEVRQQFATLAITAAERVVERSLDAKAHAELIDRVLAEGLDQRKN